MSDVSGSVIESSGIDQVALEMEEVSNHADEVLETIDALLRLTHEVVNMKQYATDDLTPIAGRLDALQQLFAAHQAEISERTTDETLQLLATVRAVLTKLKSQPMLKQWLTNTRTHAKLSTLAFRLQAFHKRVTKEIERAADVEASEAISEATAEREQDSATADEGHEEEEEGGSVVAPLGGTFNLRSDAAEDPDLVTPRPASAGGSLLAPAVLLPGLKGKASAMVANFPASARNRLRNTLPPIRTVIPSVIAQQTPAAPISIARVFELRKCLFEAAALIRSDDVLIAALVDYISTLAAYHRAVAEHSTRRDRAQDTLQRMEKLALVPSRKALVRAICTQQRSTDEADVSAHIERATLGELQQWAAEIRTLPPLQIGSLVAAEWEKARGEFKATACPLLPAEGPWTAEDMHRMLDDALRLIPKATAKRVAMASAADGDAKVTGAEGDGGLSIGTSRSHHFVEKFAATAAAVIVRRDE